MIQRSLNGETRRSRPPPSCTESIDVYKRQVLGWDPAFRTGCKLAVVDLTGKVLDTVVIYPTEPQKKIAEAKAVLKRLIKKYHITLISLGNGTASQCV